MNIPKKGKKKLDEKNLEQQMMDLLSQSNESTTSESSAISALLLFRAAKRLERYSIFLLAVTIVLAASILFSGLVLAYSIGLLP